MISVPTDGKDLLAFARDLIEQCRVSAGMRSAYCRLINQVAETGRYDGTKALLNLLDPHLARTAAHLFSPVELKFAIDYDYEHEKKHLDRAKVAAKQLTRQWDRSSTDILFGRGVYEAVKYGWCGLKQWVQSETAKEVPHYYAKLVMPWHFGVYNESENDISRQPALCETTMLTMPEVWRKIWFYPDAKKLWNKVLAHASSGQSVSDPQSYFHQVLSTSTLNTSNPNGGTGIVPGGMVNIGGNAGYQIMGPQVAAPMVKMHELWVQDDEDYTTIQLVEPDILLSPPMVGGKMIKKSNLLGVHGLQPYRTIQSNEVTNWFWGKSELANLVEPQSLLATMLDDMRRLSGIQVDKILFFMGETRITDELYGQMRMAGYGNLDQGSKVEDMTPKFPSELLPIIQFLIEQFHNNAGFPPIMQGQGEGGVRAGVHANTLMKTGSPTLRDRSLIVERQCAIAADLTMSLKEAKDDTLYHTKAKNIADVRDTEFKWTDMPEDWRVTVDSHSSSPIFADETAQLIMTGHAKGIVQTEYVLDNMPFPNVESAKAQNREAEEKKQKMIEGLMKENPAIGEKVLTKMLTGSKR